MSTSLQLKRSRVKDQPTLLVIWRLICWLSADLHYLPPVLQKWNTSPFRSHVIFQHHLAHLPLQPLLYLCPVSIHFMEENAEWVRLGGYISVQKVGSSHRQLDPSHAVLGSNAASLTIRGWAQCVGHGLRSQRLALRERKQAAVTSLTHPILMF